MPVKEQTKKLSKDEILNLRKKHLPPTAFHYYKKPVELVKAQGNYAYDAEGNEYFDAIGGIVCNSAGHNHPKIKDKIKEMLDNDEIQHTSTVFLNEHIVKLAQKIASLAPKGIDKVSLTNSGSEANELAFMSTRNATGESMVVNLKHGYHGGTSAVQASCGLHTWRFQSQPVSNVTSAHAPYCYRCPFGKNADNCNLECAKDVETTIQTTTHGKIAAFIAEPVMGIGGVITPEKEYFDAVTKIVHNYGGKYISDEVQSGAGRCGKEFFLTKELNIDADLITMAKGLGNGAPVGACAMKSEIADKLAGKLYFNTFGGDPYQSMQALKTIEIIEEENMISNAREMGDYLREKLKEMMQKYEMIGDVRGRGLLIGIELVKDKKSKAFAPKETVEVMEICKDKGLLIGKGGLQGNVLRIAPALSMNKKQADFILSVLDEAFKTVSSMKLD